MNEKILTRTSKFLEYSIKLIIVLSFIFPFFWMVSTSLKSYKETIKYPPSLWPAVINWQNFIDAWNSGPFLTYAMNSILVTLAVIVLQTIIMIPAAYAFSKYEFKGSKLMFGLVLLAFMTPTQITFVPVYLMMAKWGMIRTLLPQILPFISNAFGIFLLRQYFMQVPEELVEAAKLDNASEFKIMWKIMVPMAKPAMITIGLFSFISHWNSYFWPLVMTDTVGVRPLTIGVAMLRISEGISQWHVIMAGNVILVLPILIIYIFASKQIIKAFVYSGIK